MRILILFALAPLATAARHPCNVSTAALETCLNERYTCNSPLSLKAVRHIYADLGQQLRAVAGLVANLGTPLKFWKRYQRYVEKHRTDEQTNVGNLIQFAHHIVPNSREANDQMVSQMMHRLCCTHHIDNPCPPSDLD